MNDQRQQPSIKRDLNASIWFCQTFAYLGEAWWRFPGTSGKRYFSGQAFIGWGVPDQILIAVFAELRLYGF
jgi:hypothetical protein